MSAESLQPVQGMSDICAPEIRVWQWIEEQARRVFHLYGYNEVRTPLVEYTPLFTRAIGDTTDVVQKEMYTFDDRGGRSLSLRPEGTAGVIRHVAGLGPQALGARLYYIGPMFRCERPQAGRKRQFHQLGSEAIGPACAAADAECIAMQMHLLAEFGIHGAALELNTRGLPEDRPAVAAGLAAALQPHHAELCEDCRRRLATNILRVLDCKQAACRAVVDRLPPVTDFMAETSRQYLDEVLRLLRAFDIPVRLNTRLVRGLDYYVHTVWEITHNALGAQNALGGGGRYRIEMDGRPIEGVGFAMGIERLVAARPPAPAGAAVDGAPAVWLVALGAPALAHNLILAQTLRRRGVACGYEPAGGSMKSQMRAANKAGAPVVLICGDNELAKGLVIWKRMADGAQEELELPQVMERLVRPGP